MLRSRSPSGKQLVSGFDDLPALETIIDRVAGANDDLPEMRQLIEPPPTISVEMASRVRTAATLGAETLANSVDLVACCASLKDLVGAIKRVAFNSAPSPKHDPA